MKTLAVLAGFCAMGTCFSAEYHVSGKGLDTNDGSEAATWRTIGRAMEEVAPGDTVVVHTGTYKERVIMGTSGTPGNPITLRAADDEIAVIDGARLVPPDDVSGLIEIHGVSHVIVEGLTLRNYRTRSRDAVPSGIYIEGEVSSVEIRDNHISGIATQHRDGNAFGIAVYGSEVGPVSGLVIDGNELSRLRTGSSESLAINGNVTGFVISSNRIHDSNNIGIDFIGYEGTCPDPALDRARDGICRDNEIWNISSRSNPAYGGDLGAVGIYCDGASDILIERNRIRSCDIGIELASEHAGRSTEQITVRNNLVTSCFVTGLSLGGYEAGLGSSDDCRIVHNTFVGNDTRRTGSGEIQFQHNVNGVLVSHNVFVAGTQGLVVGSQTASAAGITFERNLYSSTKAASPPYWEWAGVTYEEFADWLAGGPGDSDSLIGNALFQGGKDFRLQASSPAVDSGDPLFAADPGETDLEGNPRILGLRVDRGAFER